MSNIGGGGGAAAHRLLCPCTMEWDRSFEACGCPVFRMLGVLCTIISVHIFSKQSKLTL